MEPAAGSSEAEFSAFVALRGAALVQLGWALTGDRQWGEDIAQTSLHRLWTRWARVSAVGDPWPYVQRIVVSQAATWRRRRWRTAELLSDGVPEMQSPRDETAEADTRSMVALWLARITPRQRAVVVLRFMYDRPVEDVAELLGCSTGTVKSQTAKALAALRASGAANRLDEIHGRSTP